MTTPHTNPIQQKAGNGHAASSSPKDELRRLLNAAGYPSWNQLVEKDHVLNWPAVTKLNNGQVPPNHFLIERLASGINVDPALIAATQHAAPLTERQLELSNLRSGPRRKRAGSSRAAKHKHQGGHGKGKTGRNSEVFRELGFMSARDFAKKHQMSDGLVSRFIEGVLPKNHPVISIFAKNLGWTEQVARASQQGKPMSEKEVLRLTSRYAKNVAAHSTAPRRGRGPGKKTLAAAAAASKKMGRPPAAKRGITAIYEASGHETWASVGKAAGLRWPYVDKLKRGKLPPNHPAIETFANALSVTVDELRTTQTAKPLDARRVGVAMRRMEAANDVTASPASRLRNHKGEMRQVVRNMITSVNVANMQGERTMEIPTADMAAFMKDYCAARGIDVNIIVMESFDKLFK